MDLHTFVAKSPYLHTFDLWPGEVGRPAFVEELLDYKGYVCREYYADEEGWEARRDETEDAWPE